MRGIRKELGAIVRYREEVLEAEREHFPELAAAEMIEESHRHQQLSRHGSVGKERKGTALLKPATVLDSLDYGKFVDINAELRAQRVRAAAAHLGRRRGQIATGPRLRLVQHPLHHGLPFRSAFVRFRVSLAN